MKTVPVTDELLEKYHQPGERAVKRVFMDAPDMETEPCEAVVHRDTHDGQTAVVTVPRQLSEAEIADLRSNGGLITLSCWGGLPPHRLDVVL